MLAELAEADAQISACQVEIEACREAIGRLEEARSESEAYARQCREEAEQAEMSAQDLKADEEARVEQIAGLEAQIQSLGIRKIKIEDEARELEAWLERPTLDQQAAAIAGPRMHRHGQSP
jgi:chromosome segregation ATPase